MTGKLFSIIVLLLALALGVIVLVAPQERLVDIVFVTRFFDVMIPILAVGALVKYLFTWHCHSKKHND